MRLLKMTVKQEDCVMIGDKWFLKEDVYSIFEPRIKEQFPED